MTATYDPTLPSDKDWVRLFIGDTDITSAQLSDEEITALLAAEPTFGLPAARYFAAATALDAIVLKLSNGGMALGDFKLGGIDIKTGLEPTIISLLQSRANGLRARGAVVSGRNKVVRAFGGQGRHGQRIVSTGTR